MHDSHSFGEENVSIGFSCYSYPASSGIISGHAHGLDTSQSQGSMSSAASREDSVFPLTGIHSVRLRPLPVPLFALGPSGDRC